MRYMLRVSNPIFLLALGLAVVLPPAARAQGRGPGGASGGVSAGVSGGGFGGRGGFSRGEMGERFHGGDLTANSGRSSGPVHAGFQVGPPGRWWDDKSFAKGLGIEPEQRRRMDEIFNGSKGELSARLNDLRREESTMGSLNRVKELDEPRIMTQIDRVAQARAELEKSYARMLLSIRKELTPEQVKKLSDQDAQVVPAASPTE